MHLPPSILPLLTAFLLLGCTPRQEESRRFSQAFFRDSVDMQQLYDAGRQQEALAAWFGSFASEDSLLVETKALLTRVAKESPAVLKPLVRDICAQLYSQGARQAATVLAAFCHGVDPATSPVAAGRLLQSTLLPGKVAPPIKGLRHESRRPVATILLFYDSACRSCQQIIAGLTDNYDSLRARHIRVVSISMDTDKKAYLDYAIRFPWPDVLCDYQAFQGETPTRYGVAFTPILFLIDSSGKVMDWYGSLEELLLEEELVSLR